MEGYRLLVIFEVHGKSDKVGNVTNLVQDLIGIIGGNGL